MKENLLNRLSCENSQKKQAVSGTIVGLSAVRSTLYKEKPAVFLCYDVNIDSDQTSVSTDEIDEIKWADLSEPERIGLGLPNYAQPCIGWFEWRANVIEVF